MLHIFGGGTVNHVRNHMALCAPAYGSTAKHLARMCRETPELRETVALELTRMADQAARMETNADVAIRLDELLAQAETRAIVFNVALCDFEGRIGDVPSGKYAERLRTREGGQALQLTPAPKLLSRIKEQRPDVFLVGFKTTADATADEQIALALRQIEETTADLVLANDTVTRQNILVVGGEWAGTVLASSTDRQAVLEKLVRQLKEHA